MKSNFTVVLRFRSSGARAFGQRAIEIDPQSRLLLHLGDESREHVPLQGQSDRGGLGVPKSSRITLTSHINAAAGDRDTGDRLIRHDAPVRFVAWCGNPAPERLDAQPRALSVPVGIRSLSYPS